MILLPKTSAYVKSCVWMYFLIEYDDLLGKYIWDKVSGDIKKEPDCEPIYYNKSC